jgi:hypothetical protein
MEFTKHLNSVSPNNSSCCHKKCLLPLFRSPSKVPRVELPEELFVNIAVAVGTQVNKFLSFLQDVSCERNLKHFVLVCGPSLGSYVLHKHHE